MIAPPLPQTSPRGLTVLASVAALAFLSRVPFIPGSGLGVDADAWRIALAGQMLVDTGEYRTSRPPSYPLVEFVATGLTGAPWWVYTLLTAAVSAVGVAAFADLLRTLQVRAWLPATAGLALTPVFYRSSVMFLDYVWSVSLLLVGLALLARRRHVPAGVMLGLAVAARPATAVVGVVVVLVLALTRRPGGDWLRVALPAALVGVVLFAAPLASYGLSFVTATYADVPPLVAAARATSGVWGSLGAVAVVVAVLAAGVVVVRRGVSTSGGRRPWVVAAFAGVVAQGAVYLTLPLEPGYLMPAVPLLWLILAAVLSTAPVAVLATAVGLSVFLAPSSSIAFGTTILQDAQDRREQLAYVTAAAAAIEQLPAGTTVVAGPLMPQLLALQDRSVLADPALGGPGRAIEIPERVALPGGQVILYAPDSGAPGSGQTVRLASGGSDAPTLPVAAFLD